LVSSNVPSQQTTVPIIQDLLTVVESNLINKVKVIGMQELEGSTNSNVLWSEEFELEIPVHSKSVSDPVSKKEEDSFNLSSKKTDSIIFNNKARESLQENLLLLISNNKRVAIGILSVLALFLFLSITNSSHVFKPKLSDSQDANQAIDSLKKLKSDLGIGMNKSEYRKKVSDVKYTVEMFAGTKEAGINPVFTRNILSALEEYVYALSLWDFDDSIFRYRGSILSEILDKYPELENEVNRSDTDPRFDLIKRDTVIQYIWKKATEDIESANLELKK